MAKTGKKHPLYWKVKAAFLQHQKLVAEANAAVAASSHAFNQAMKDAGLDPEKEYTMSDAGETITLKA